MALSTSKRNLLFARNSQEKAFRPPWSISEKDFIETCTRCGECFKECPSNVIKIGDGGFPELDFSHAGCDFCQVCVQVCQPGALKIRDCPALNSVAHIDENCFSERGVICRSCGEICNVGAIRFKPAVGGITHVLLNTELCNGCGECVHLCPAQSITMKHRTTEEICA